ncbi:UvrD-like helicase family protein [Desulfobotulus alkaliphilus]|uniref:DNA 3'-5' helicase n=1 Tax=Desulfobotulus alkaliphilus TaxID=622671 RepID=A0A562RVG9_9BACT|nr:UvrD-helicase domain-containing protein [Desulfobotulus alkaliphilus]TWI73042.1 UvrD-like helicase family protein [Desulfobotulus alkaliphilus]
MAINDIQVAISDDFFSAFARIPQKQQTKVQHFLTKFQQDPTASGINYEKLHQCRDPRIRSVRIDQTYRGIVLQPKSGNVYMLLWVDHHDRAYEWAKNRICDINPQLGAVQIYRVTEKEEPQAPEDKKDAAMFSSLRDKDLLRLGLPEKLLGDVRSIETEPDLKDFAQSCPEHVYEALVWLSQGESYDDVLSIIAEQGVQEKEGVDTEDFTSALDHPVSRHKFYIAPTEKALLDMLHAPLENWRTFLHPSQRRLVEKSWSGPVRVLGGAGTGKTVVAMHRAKWLAEHMERKSSKKILFTTFTKNLAADIQANLEKIMDKEDFDRIKVINLDRWVMEFLSDQGHGFTVDYGEKSKELWQQSLEMLPSEMELSLGFLKEEWDEVIQPLEISDLDSYIRTERRGRGLALSRQEREGIWPVFERYMGLMDQEKLREPADMMRDARLYLEKGNPSGFGHIIVDEAQDMGVQAFRLLRAMVSEGPDDLFIVGDAHQRIYSVQAALSQCGIRIVGRSTRLRINYRTSEETRRWAMALMKDVFVDDLDGGEDQQEGYISLIHGTEPQILAADNPEAECDAIADHLRLIERNEGALNACCVVLRTHKLLQQYSGELEKRGLVLYPLLPSKPDDREEPGVRIGTMHRVKGLEFDHMLICGMNEDAMPLMSHAMKSEDPEIRKKAEMRDRALLFMAVTRAKKSVFLSGSGKISPWLGENLA